MKLKTYHFNIKDILEKIIISTFFVSRRVKILAADLKSENEFDRGEQFIKEARKLK